MRVTIKLMQNFRLECIVSWTGWFLFSFFYAGDTRSRNFVQKLVQVVWYQKLARVSLSVNLVQGYLHAIEHSSIPAQKLSSTWHEPCNVIGRRFVLVQETNKTKQMIFRASFCYKFLERVWPALSWRWISIIHRISSRFLANVGSGYC